MMKTIDVQMDITYDIDAKKITSMRLCRGNLSLPGVCVVCNQPSTKVMPVFLDVEGLGAAFEFQQPMPYCQKHQIQLSLIRFLNILPAIITIGLAVYLFFYLGGFGGDNTRFISSYIFFAFFLGAVLYFFFRPVIKSFHNGTSGTGVNLTHHNPSKVFRVEENPALLSFMFVNDAFADAITRLNPNHFFVSAEVDHMPS